MDLEMPYPPLKDTTHTYIYLLQTHRYTLSCYFKPQTPSEALPFKRLFKIHSSDPHNCLYYSTSTDFNSTCSQIRNATVPDTLTYTIGLEPDCRHRCP